MISRWLGLSQDDPVHAITSAFLANMFSMAAYYVAQPVRDELSGRDLARLPYLFTLSLLATFAANRIMSWLFTRSSPSYVLPWVARHFALHYGLIGVGIWGAVPGVGDVLFLWLGVFLLTSNTLLWTVLSKNLSKGEALRAYGICASGSSVGQIVGSLLTHVVSHAAQGPTLMLLSALLSLVSSLFMDRLVRELRQHRDAAEPPKTLTTAVTRPASTIWGIFQSPVWTLLGAHIFFVYFFNSTLFIAKQHAFSRLPGQQRRTQSRALFNLATGLTCTLFQWFASSRFLSSAFLGVPRLITVSSLSMLSGLLLVPPLFSFLNTLSDKHTSAQLIVSILSIYLIIRKVLAFSFGKPSREAIFTVCQSNSPDFASRKNFLDTFCARSADAIGAFASGPALSYLALASPPATLSDPQTAPSSKFPLYSIWSIYVLLAALWFALSLKLGSQYRVLATEPHKRETLTV